MGHARGDHRVMRKRLIPAVMLAAYGAVVIRILVFKIELIRIGPLRFRFSQHAGEASFVPFKSILSYLRGEPMGLIAILNIFGNIALFVPIGFLVPFILQGVTWRTALALAVAAGLAIEATQVVLGVGIFDIDDVLLNALGVMIGYGAFGLFVEKGSRKGS